MSSEMPLKKLGNVCGFVRGPFGGSLKKSFFKPDGYAVYEQQHAINNQFDKIRYFVDDDKFEEMKRFEVFPGDLIMSCSGTMGKVAIVPDKIKRGIINQALLKLSPSNDLDVHYLKYWMESNDFQESIAKQAKGVAIKNVASVKVLKEIEIPCPSKKEQQQIVTLLDQAFAAIDQAKANVERNLENAKVLFQSKLNEIFSQKGEGWEEKKLKEIGETQTGSTPSTKDRENYGDHIPFVKPAHFKDDGSIDAEESMLSEKGLKKGRLFKENSVLMVCIGATIGKTGFSTIPISSNQQINALTPKEKYVPKIFYYAMITDTFFQKVLRNASQATLPIINKSKWENLTVSFPSDRMTQKAIVLTLDDLKKRTIELQKIQLNKLDHLENLKKSILQKAFTGELTVASKEPIA